MPIAHRPFRMIAAPVCLMGLQACATVPMAPLVYGSKTVGGFDISTSTGANPSVSISLGYKRDDLALVPIAVRSQGEKGEHLVIVKGEDANKDATPPAPRVADKDALSVFGSFEGRGIGGASTPATSINAMAANYFSTGIAAQKLAGGFGKAERLRQLTHCFNAVKETSAVLAAADQAAAVKAGMTACGTNGND
ncbi:MAG: hypothetical protein RBS05_09610 [Zoogloea oleivorans]|uniref:Lipoprotein n=2 Tax=Zoogloea TaxID=349 RepID=A0A6C2D621_9RHOO|nr:hypothetical protein [Zoogloea oleivorans]MBT9496879.1 hypothetical protein [Zoogloea sp.]MDY0036153.1 hypothetical protein [Zoogloea oleivorans]TYC61461.1 hypothetical protein ETQ85_01980 [Zoogloea oleivorans]